MDNLWLMVNSYPLVIADSLLLKMTIEIGNFPKNGDFPYRVVFCMFTRGYTPGVSSLELFKDVRKIMDVMVHKTC